MLKVLLCASEVAPIIKVGGLGDVVGSLPKALERLGVDADVVVPFFPTAKIVGLKIYKSREILVPFNHDFHRVEVWATKLPASTVDLYLLKNDAFFNAGGRSAFLGTASETEAFSFFSRAVVELIKGSFNTYDVIHCNDWHTGLVTHFLADELGLSRPATIMTIHNILYQGSGDQALVAEAGLDPEAHRSIKWDIADGDINLLMQGIMASDFINTVSPSYAAELLRADDGSKINEVLTARKDRFIGILNGLDYTTLPRTIVKTNWQSSKGSDKSTLQQELKLAPDDRPIFAMVSRLDPAQKGLALLAEVVPFIVQQGGQFILLGSGNQEWEARFTQQATELGVQNMSVTTAFDPELALRIYQGSDFFLIPSSFEPCGLTQMIAMWYGSVPIAHATGGLKDTIKHGKTGFLFTDFTAEAFKNCLIKCFNLYKSPAHFAIVEACLGQHFGFDESAKAYLELYEKAVQIRKDAYGPVYL